MTDINYAERTVNPYETEGPGDGRTWHEYFADMRNARTVAKDEEVEARVIIEVAFHEVPVPDFPQVQTAYTLSKKWFDTLLYGSVALVEGAVYKTGERAGQKRPDRQVRTHRVIGRSGLNRFTAYFEDAKMQFAKALWDGQFIEFRNITEVRNWFKEL